MKGVAAVEMITIRVSLASRDDPGRCFECDGNNEEGKGRVDIGDDRLAELNPPVGPAVAYPFS